MPAPYEIRAGGDVKNKKQSMADLKLRRLNELNSRLKEDLERPRIKVSEASMSVAGMASLSYIDPFYAQELLSTFGTSLGEVALAPATGGVFTVDVIQSSISDEAEQAMFKPRRTQLWDRKTEGGFPGKQPLFELALLFFSCSPTFLVLHLLNPSFHFQETRLIDPSLETKRLKQLVRDIIEPSRDLGHVDRHGPDPKVDNQIDLNVQSQIQSPPPDQHKAIPRSNPSVTSTAEDMVSSIMSVFPDRPTNDDGRDRQPTPREVSASRTAEKMVADIMSSFQDEKAAEIGGGSGELGTRQEGDHEAEGAIQKAEEENEVQGVHSARQGCEDCG
ncbi:MAG: hypothetical protein Q9166_006988 [cf. Caloplaca sp. 2 TL-2023]